MPATFLLVGSVGAARKVARLPRWHLEGPEREHACGGCLVPAASRW